MSVQMIETPNINGLEIHVSGKLAREDYEAFVPLVMGVAAVAMLIARLWPGQSA